MSLLIKPTNIKTSTFRNGVDITFTKGANASKTEIWKGWDNENPFQITAYSKFSFSNLEWGKTHKFQLFGYSDDGRREDSEVLEFAIEPEVIATLPTNITIEKYKNNATVKFKKGTCTKTELVQLWDNKVLSTVSGEAFFLNDLPWGQEYSFILRSVSNNPERNVETSVYKFSIEQEIIPTLPTNITHSVYRNGVDITFVRGTAKSTEIDFNDAGWTRSTVSGTKFDYRDLEWGKTYKYRLRSTSNGDKVAETGYYQFKIDDLVVPVLPTDVKTSVFRNNVDISFTKNGGVKTQIDCFWTNGEGTFDTETISGSKFSFQGLEWGKTYQFRLRSVGNDGSTLDTGVYSFDIAQLVLPVLPTNVKHTVYKNNVDIAFDRNGGVKTQLNFNNEGFTRETVSGNKFSLPNVPWGKTYPYVLRSVGNDGSTLDTQVFNVAIDPEIIPTAPTNVKVSVYKNGADITFDRGVAKSTEINFNGEGWTRSTVTGTKFDYRDLEWGKTYTFKLRSTSNGDKTSETNEYTFKIEDLIVPVAPTNVACSIFKNNVDIDFTRNSGVKTQIDAYWIDGQGTFDQETVSGTRFSFANLPWGQTYKFKLRSTGNDGSVADTQELSFVIPEEIIPVAPSNVKISVFKTNVDIEFNAGVGVKTEIDAYWVNGQGTWDSQTVTGTKFSFSDLSWGTTFKFKLRCVGNSGLTAETQEYTFSTVPSHVPTVPQVVSRVVEGNKLVVTFNPGANCRTRFKLWSDEGVNGAFPPVDKFTLATEQDKFIVEDLYWRLHYYFTIQDENPAGDVAVSQVYDFWTSSPH